MLENRCIDGGMYLPETIPELSRDAIGAMGNLRLNTRIAGLCNLFMDSPISEWDLDFSVGRRSVRFRAIDRKTVLLECWHNPEGTLSYLTRYLADLTAAGREPGYWLSVLSKITVLGAGISGLLAEKTIDWGSPVDIAAASGDFSAVLAGWYLRQMGFPIGRILCCCNENNALWELVHLGQLRTDGVCVQTETPDSDILIPAGLEHLIFYFGGIGAVANFSKSLQEGCVYIPEEEILRLLRENLFVSVVSGSRMRFTIAGVMQTCGYPMSPYGALSYAGVQDYRTKSNENHYTVILCEKSPVLDRETVAAALGISAEALEKRL